MRTTLNIKDDIIKQVIELTGAKNKSQAVNQVLEAFVREKQTQKLLKLKGKLHLEDNWKKLREMEPLMGSEVLSSGFKVQGSGFNLFHEPLNICSTFMSFRGFHGFFVV